MRLELWSKPLEQLCLKSKETWGSARVFFHSAADWSDVSCWHKADFCSEGRDVRYLAQMRNIALIREASEPSADDGRANHLTPLCPDLCGGKLLRLR
jgi:hypothetical protein